MSQLRADRERRLLEFLREPRTLDEIAAHRFVYRPQDPVSFAEPVERRSLGQHVTRLHAAERVREIEPGRFVGTQLIVTMLPALGVSDSKKEVKPTRASWWAVRGRVGLPQWHRNQLQPRDVLEVLRVRRQQLEVTLDRLGREPQIVDAKAHVASRLLQASGE